MTAPDTGVIRTARQLLDLIGAGRELWHIGESRYLGIPGRWEIRGSTESERRPVHWDAIIHLRRSAGLVRWAQEHTEEVEISPGRAAYPGSGTYCYRLKQGSLVLKRANDEHFQPHRPD